MYYNKRTHCFPSFPVTCGGWGVLGTVAVVYLPIRSPTHLCTSSLSPVCIPVFSHFHSPTLSPAHDLFCHLPCPLGYLYSVYPHLHLPICAQFFHLCFHQSRLLPELWQLWGQAPCCKPSAHSPSPLCPVFSSVQCMYLYWLPIYEDMQHNGENKGQHGLGE